MHRKLTHLRQYWQIVNKQGFKLNYSSAPAAHLYYTPLLFEELLNALL